MILDVYNTHMELYPYKQDDYPSIEDMFMATDKMSGNQYACGFIIEDGKLFLPRGASISKIEYITQCTVNYIKEPDEWDNMRRKYFPRYEPRNKLQEDSIEFLCEPSPQLSLNLQTGFGKGVPVFTKLPAPNANGYILMGDLKIGDKLFGSNGQPVTVTGIYDQGVEDVYKITFNDGRYALCDENHLWSVFYAWTKTQITVSTKEMLTNYKKFSNYKYRTGRDPYEYRYRIPLLASPVQYPHRDVPIDPYIIGAFIGNGCNTLHGLALSSGDDFVPKKIARILNCYLKYPKTGYTYYFYKETTDKRELIRTKEFFKDVPELVGYSYEKFIPEIYLYNDLETRMELLRGLMDTDGSISYSGGRFNILYSSCSRKLLEQIRELILGLGFISNILSPDKRVEKYTTGYHSQVSIRVPNKFKQFMFTHPTKQKIAYEASLRGDRIQPFTHLFIKDIQNVTKAQCKCITVDSSDHLFLTENFIVTHNTFCVGYSAAKLQEKILVITPNDGLKQQWIKTFHQMIGVPEERLINITGSPFMEGIMIDKVEPGDAYFVNHQTLRSYLTNNGGYALHQFFKKIRVGIKVYDECHMEFGNILLMDFFSNTKRTWYLTATFARTDKSELECYKRAFSSVSNFGYEESKEMVEKHVIYHIVNINSHIDMKARYKLMRYPGFTAPRYGQYAIFDDPNETLYKAILMILDKCKDVEGKIIIFLPLIDAVDKVAEKLRKDIKGKKVGAYHSKVSKDEKEEAQKRDIIVTTIKSCGTGTDIKGLRVIINAEPVASKVVIEQTIGRLRPYGEGMNTFFFDIIDRSINCVCWWMNARFKKIETLVKEVITFDI